MLQYVITDSLSTSRVRLTIIRVQLLLLLSFLNKVELSSPNLASMESLPRYNLPIDESPRERATDLIDGADEGIDVLTEKLGGRSPRRVKERMELLRRSSWDRKTGGFCALNCPWSYGLKRMACSCCA